MLPYSHELKLETQDTCPNPSCKVSWKAIADSLETSPFGSDDLAQALIIIMNCPVCQDRFQKQLEKIDRVNYRG